MFGSDVMLQRLEAFQVWLEDRGLRAAPTRIGNYIRDFRRFASVTEIGELSYDLYNEFVFLLREVHDLLLIFEALEIQEPPGVLEVLDRSLGGSALARDDSSSASARNFQLELRIAGYFIRAGYPVDLSLSADLKVRLPSGTLYAECKRISSPKKVRARARGALKQIQRRLTAHKGGDRAYGLAVFDVSQVLHPGQGVSSGRSPMVVRQGLRTQLLDFDEEYQIGDVFSREKDVLAVWLQITAPVVHARGPETRYSSLYLPLAPNAGPRARAFQDLRKAFEVMPDGFPLRFE